MQKIEPAQRAFRNRIVILLAFIALFSSVIITFQVIIDPFFVWGSPLREGVNNIRIGQRNQQRLFKVYQYAEAKPDVVYFGSSRVRYGVPATWPGVPDEKVYNMGINGLHIPEQGEFVEFCLDTHTPKVAIFGLDLIQFNRVTDFRTGFSKDRLEMVSASAVTAFFSKFAETAFCFDAIHQSIFSIWLSRERPRTKRWDIRGWSRYMGRRRVSLGDYIESAWPIVTSKRKRSDQVVPETLHSFRKTLQQLKRAGVEVHVFMNPLSAEMLGAFRSHGFHKELERLKRELVHITPLWDFANVNTMTLDRRNYINFDHYNDLLGSKITARVSGQSQGFPKDFGIYLTKDNVEQELRKIDQRLNNWREKNDEIYTLFRQARKKRDKSAFMKAAPSIFPI